MGRGEIENPYRFYNESWLLREIKIPGNSSDIALSDSAKIYIEDKSIPERGLEYMAHNMDSREQQFCTTALFSKWAEAANMFCQ